MVCRDPNKAASEVVGSGQITDSERFTKSLGAAPKVAANSKRGKTERKSSPEPIPNPKQRPSIRAPTRSPSGEKGPEGSWLRVLKVSDPKHRQRST